MTEQFSRMEMLLGSEAVRRLGTKKIAIFGVGGVGSYTAEAAARAGVGDITLFDGDRVCLSNINRQLVALHSTLGQYKAEAAKSRLLDINPAARITAHSCFYTAENADEFPFDGFDYIVDAIDSVRSKILLIKRAAEAGTPIISSMGAGNKLDPTRFQVADIYETEICPLARVMRRELRKAGIKALKTVYSKEPPAGLADGPRESSEFEPQVRRPPGSISFVPSVAGLIIAGEMIKDLIGADSGEK